MVRLPVQSVKPLKWPRSSSGVLAEIGRHLGFLFGQKPRNGGLDLSEIVEGNGVEIDLAFIGRVEFYEIGKLFAARVAPCSPKIDQQRFAVRFEKL